MRLIYMRILILCVYSFFVFFFKQKTAYEMRISDWSSDVCSSDLPHNAVVIMAMIATQKRRQSLVDALYEFQCRAARLDAPERLQAAAAMDDERRLVLHLVQLRQHRMARQSWADQYPHARTGRPPCPLFWAWRSALGELRRSDEHTLKSRH